MLNGKDLIGVLNLSFSYRTTESWRYVSYSLVHANLEHLLVNLFLLVSVGCGLEAVHGTVRVATLYLLGVSHYKIELILTLSVLSSLSSSISSAGCFKLIGLLLFRLWHLGGLQWWGLLPPGCKPL